MSSWDRYIAKRTSIGSSYKEDRETKVLYFCEDLIKGKVCGRPIMKRRELRCRECREKWMKGLSK